MVATLSKRTRTRLLSLASRLDRWAAGKGDVDFHGYFQQDGYPKLMVNFTSTLCRRVQVGTQTVEQPIYETICGELGELPEGAAPSAPAPETPAIEGIPPSARNGSEMSLT